MPDAAQPLAEPVGPDPKRWKPSVRHRVLAQLRMFWKLVKAVAGRGPTEAHTLEEIERIRLARRIRARARWAAAWVVPPAACVGFYVAGESLLPTSDVDGLLRSVLPAAALTSGLLAAGLMNATAQSKELRRRRVDALRECQRDLQPVRRAFDMLEVSFNEMINKGEHLTRFLDCVVLLKERAACA